MNASVLSVLRSHFRLSDYPLNRPSGFDALSKSAIRKADSPSPLRNAVSLTVEGKISVSAHILTLLFWSGPTAIVRAITGIIVDSIQRMPIWTITHIGLEIRKRFTPPATDADTSTAVVGVAEVGCVVTAGDHVGPSYELRRFPVTSYLSVNSNGVDVQTPATASAAAPQRIAQNNNFTSAVAYASPPDVIAFSIVNRHDDKSQESLSRQVDELHALASMWASMMRRTSSAMDMPSRLASRFRNALCGSVNEIICLVIGPFQMGVRVQAGGDVFLDSVSLEPTSTTLALRPMHPKAAISKVVPHRFWGWNWAIRKLAPLNLDGIIRAIFSAHAAFLIETPEKLYLGSSRRSRFLMLGNFNGCVFHAAMIPQGIQS